MDLLFRLKKKRDDEHFKNIKAATKYFRDTLPARDGSYFYTTVGRPKLERGDTIYFSFDNYIIATGEFTDRIVNKERSEKFKHGLGLVNIKTWEPVEKLNYKMVGTWTTNLDPKKPQRQNEVDRVLQASDRID